MTGYYEGLPRAERVEVITSVQRRRRWSTEEKVRIVEETYLPGNSVSLVARHYGIAGNQLFTWRRLGRVDKSDPDPDCCELHEAKKARGELVVAGGDAA